MRDSIPLQFADSRANGSLTKSTRTMQTLEVHVAKQSGGNGGSNPGAIEPWVKTLTLALVLVASWLMTHRYRGLEGDAELYAVQAMARIHSNLWNDLFLRNTSQDTFTVFSPFYAWCIALLGLRNAALVLTIVCKIWFFTAAWALARSLSDTRTAFLAVALLIITVGAYGAYGVFRYAEDWITARSLAEALVLTALALYLRGARVIGLLVACGAMFVHPLMALPGMLLLVSLWCSRRMSLLGATAGVLASLTIALDALRPSSAEHFLTVMDADWLEVVRERSQFLFLQLWSFADWRQNARPFVSLALSALVITDPRIRKLCTSAMLVGVSGLAVALIGSVVGPVTLLLQGQSWRWVWVTGFVSVLFLVPTILVMRRDQRCGHLCAILLIAAWTIPPIDGAACVTCALILWSLRDRINARATLYTRWIAAAVGALIAAWAIKASWSIAFAPPKASAHELLAITRLKGILELQILSLALIGALICWIDSARSTRALTVTGVALLTATAFLWRETFQDKAVEGSAAAIAEFKDWRGAIPPDSNVFVVPARISARFAWFTLDRPSYLTVDQSAGVVFSRETALEVRRRSQVLLPLMDEDWRLLSASHTHRGADGKSTSRYRPLTRDRLIRLCSDPQLNFVVAQESVGFGPIQHKQPGNWRDWNLYDCRRVQAEAPAA